MVVDDDVCVVEPQPQQRISLGELYELRVEGLGVDELLAVLAACCDFLTAVLAANGRKACGQFDGVFSPDTVFIGRDGDVWIEPEPICAAAKEFTPPELRRVDAAVATAVGTEPQLVWCLGEVASRGAAPDFADVGLLSLLNLMTVDASVASSRPSLAKLRQMLRNRASLAGGSVVNDERARRATLTTLYAELMGDIGDLIDDKFCDDIRYSSTRSSLSIISGGAAQRDQTDAEDTVVGLDVEFSRLDDVNAQTDDDDETRSVTPTPAAASASANPFDLDTEERSTKASANLFDDEAAASASVNPFDSDAEERSTKESANPFDEEGQHSGKNEQAVEEAVVRKLSGVPESTSSTLPSAVFKTERANGIASQRPSPLTELTEEGVPDTSVAQPSTTFHNGGGGAMNQFKKDFDENVFATTPPPVVSARRRGSVEPFGASSSSPQQPPHHRFVQRNQQRRAPATVKPSPPLQLPDPEDGQFSRQNSLEPSRITRGSSRCRRPLSMALTVPQAEPPQRGVVTAGGVAIPEFLERSAQPLIRLRAQSMKKKKVVSLHRQENALVVVRLLNGQRVVVNCRTDACVSNVFETVAAHLNLSEHLFFGLALLRNSEYYFLDGERRLEKWAPPGWKNSSTNMHASASGGGGFSRSSPLVAAYHHHRQTSASIAAGPSPLGMSPSGGTEYLLHFRFRYYPKKLDFVRTENTCHNLYLQLRQDILEGALRFPVESGDELFRLAAFALQAEYGNAPPSASPNVEDNIGYFKLDNYFPLNYCSTNDATTTAGAPTTAAVSSAQMAASPVAAASWSRDVAVRHRALVECRPLDAERRFIATCQSALGYGAHYYRVGKVKPATRHHDAYFSRLADAHRLALMPIGIAVCREQTTTGVRHLQAVHEWHAIRTLQFDRKRLLIATIEQSGIAADHVFYTDHYSKSSYLVRFAASQHRFMMKMRHWQSTLNRVKGGGVDGDASDVGVDVFASPSANANNGNGALESGHFEAQKVSVKVDVENENVLIDTQKQRRTNTPSAAQASRASAFNGDGSLLAEINADYWRRCYGVGDDAKTLRVRLAKDAHVGLGLTLVDGAVDDVKGVYVKSVAPDGDGHRKGLHVGDCLVSVNGVSLLHKTRHDAVELVRAAGTCVELELLRFPFMTEMLAAETTTSTTTATAHRKRSNSGGGHEAVETVVATADNARKKSSVASTTSAAALLRPHQRAVSDFGAIGDTLPVLNSDELLIGGTVDRRQSSWTPEEGRRNGNVSDSSASSSSSSMENSAKNTVANGDSTDGTLKRGRYSIAADAANADVSSIYTFHHDDDEDEEDAERAGANPATSGAGNYRRNNGTAAIRPLQYYRGGGDNSDSLSWAAPSTLSGGGNRYRTNQGRSNNSKTSLDWLNDVSDDECDAGDGQSVETAEAKLMKRRRSDQPQQQNDNNNNRETLITVHFDKSQCRSIGLSLAKRMGHDGVFIRNITAGSLADGYGLSGSEEASPPQRLMVGDRVWAVNGRVVADESAMAIVKRLAQIDGRFAISVKRRANWTPPAVSGGGLQ